MPQPQRPFIPHRTPNKPRLAPAVAEFRLTRPFVPGAERAPVAAAEQRAGDTELGLRGIEEFLQVGSPAQLATETVEESFEEYEERDELPPVEHFLDPLPPVSHFVDDFPAEVASQAPREQLPGGAGSQESDEGWLETAWQNYDWGAAGALGETGESEASSAWAETDWESTGPRTNVPRPTAAQAIASALDQIAQKIRDGELVLPPAASDAASDPSTIAATLASLLGIRQ